jgi:hypothetical protein
MVYFILFFYFLHWVMSLTNYENGVAIVKRLRTTGLGAVATFRICSGVDIAIGSQWTDSVAGYHSYTCVYYDSEASMYCNITGLKCQ